jgi:hypothetical protein
MSAPSVSKRIRKKQLEKALSKVKNERVKKLLVEHLSTVIEQLPSARKNKKPLTGNIPPLPERFLPHLGQRRWSQSDRTAAAIKLAHAIYEATNLKASKPGFAERFKKVLDILERQQRAIYESTDLLDLMTTIADHEGKKLPRRQYKNLLQRFASKASEDAAIRHPEFLAEVGAKSEEMERLAADSKQLARLHLASLDPTPHIFTKMRAPGSSGPTEARYLYIDIWVAYTGQSHSNQVRYISGIKAQIKLFMVETLVPHTDVRGRERIGQLLNDEVRGLRGPWRCHEARIPLEAIIDDPRMRTVISMGSQDLTGEQWATLKDEQWAILKKDGIKRKHILHDIPYGDFYDWAHAALKAANITMTP